jgi:hypothetical protein
MVQTGVDVRIGEQLLAWWWWRAFDVAVFTEVWLDCARPYAVEALVEAVGERLI